MVKNKSKIISFVFLLTLVIACVIVNNTSSVNASESNSKAQSISALNYAIGVKTDLYNTTQNIQQEVLYGLPQEDVNSIFTSTQGSFHVKCSFVDNLLTQIYFSDIKGSLLTSQPIINNIETAKKVLNNFEKFTNDSVYGQFAAMLNGIESDKNASLIVKNVDLEITNFEGKAASYVWTYVDSNGVKADRKNIVLSFEDGQLIGFINNWPLYKVVGTPKLSADVATSVAIEASKNFSYEVTYDNKTVEKVTGFKIAPESLGHGVLAYTNFYEQNYARDSDPFTLYPLWYVPLGFDKFYPGDVSGMIVAIWADTGKIGGMQEVTTDSNFGTPIQNDKEPVIQDSSLFATQALSPTIMLMALILVGVIFTSPIYKTTLKRNPLFSRKIITLFFSGLVLLCIISTALSEAAADPNPYGKSRIYSCENTPTGYYNNTADSAEKVATAEISNYVGNLTQDNGYSTNNLHGTYTTISSVINNISPDDQNYGRTILLHTGHFSERGRAYQSDNGSVIWDTSIYGQTSNARHSFVFLWVCTLAENPEINGLVQWKDYPTNTFPGVPIAWTHRDNTAGHPLMSSNGFTSSDGSGQCYISFYGFSPMVSGLPLHTFSGYTPTNCKEFVKKFYYYAIHNDLSVHAAIDQASYYYFGVYFSTSPLNVGYDSYWPGGNLQPPMNHSGYYPAQFEGHTNDPKNKMKIYGDANIHLYQPRITLTANYGLSPTFSIDGHSYSTGDVRVIPTFHIVSVDSSNIPPQYYFVGQVYEGHGSAYGSPANIQLFTDGTLRAYYNYVPPPAPPSQPQVQAPQQPICSGLSYSFSAVSTDPNGDAIRYTFNWGDSTSDTTNWYSSGQTATASHTWSSTGYYTVTVTAQDSTGRWSDPTYVSLQVVPASYQIFVSAYDSQWNEVPTGVWIDGNWAGYAPIYSYSASIGQHTIEVENYVGYWSFVCFDGYGTYVNPITVNVANDNVAVTAYYMYG